MKNRLFIFLILFGIAQHAEILSSSNNNRFTTLDEDSDTECTTNSKERSNSSYTKESRFDSYKKNFANLATSQRIAMMQKIDEDLDDASTDSDESTEEGIKFHFYIDYYSVCRNSGLMVKTNHLKATAESEYLNYLEPSHADNRKNFKGTILPANEVQELLEREKSERQFYGAK